MRDFKYKDDFALQGKKGKPFIFWLLLLLLLSGAAYGLYLFLTKASGQEPSHRSGDKTQVTVPLEIPPLPKKVAPQANNPKNVFAWETHRIAKGEALSSLFAKHRLPISQLYQILTLEHTSPLRRVQAGKNLRWKRDAKGLKTLHYALDTTQTLVITRKEGKFQSQVKSLADEQRILHAAGTIEHSLFQSGNRAGLSDRIMMELVTVFAWDIDFSLDLHAGDQFTLVYQAKYYEGESLSEGPILAAEFVNQGKVYKALRYTDQHGRSGYYSPEGVTVRKGFLRAPVHFTRISSHFRNNRKHPILNRIRAHKGVDYAAPTGTPIYATGSGKISFRGKKNGYGKTLIIQHEQEVSTLYAHLSRFHSKAPLGRQVRQGQLIGYVGKSGLATGPHLHYEFRVKGVHRNPLAVKQIRKFPLPKKEMARFHQKTQALLAQLKHLRQIMLASNY